jgi:hypothetical protein
MSFADEDMRAVELEIAVAPAAHPMVKGLRGARKARIALPGRGKRGGARVVYFVAPVAEVLFMLTAYPKNEQDDLRSDQRKAILKSLESIKGGAHV